MFWTDKDNRDLIADKFPWFLSTYDSLPHAVQRADCARYFYMLQYGGCYFDLDFESLKPLEPLLADVQVALGYMSKNIPHELSLPNAFLASVPGHKLWHYVIKHVLKNCESGKVNIGDAHRVTGPIMLKEAVADYQSTAISKDLTIFPPDKVYGVDWLWRDDKSMQSAFKLAEVDLTPLLPPEALAPFAEEISGRQKRRHRRAEQEARMAQREAADAADAAAAAAIKGLTAQELKAMPKPSNPAAALAAASMTEEDALDAAIAQSLGLSGSPDENGDLHGAGPDGAALPPEAGVSFANIAKMGFAATGPKLSPGAPEMGRANAQHGSPGADMGGPLGPVWGPQLPGSKPAVASQGNSASAWGSSKGSTLASQLAAAETKAAAAAVDAAKDRSKGKKAAKQMVLLSTTQRRYT
ncbi:TPA: hypothetical protein ACH3X2_005387 [Trebouxia sp. C0005]